MVCLCIVTKYNQLHSFIEMITKKEEINLSKSINQIVSNEYSFLISFSICDSDFGTYQDETQILLVSKTRYFHV